MKQKLNPIPQKEGFVYVYEAPRNEGLIKIKYTTNTIETRLGG
jgi:hypothetical protein